MNELRDQLSSIFRYIEADLGTSELANLVMQTIIEATKNFQSNSVDEYYKQFREVMILVKNSKPRIGIIITFFCDIWDELQKKKKQVKTKAEINKLIEATIKKIVKDNNEDSNKLTKLGISCIDNNDNILIHSHSHTVLKVLAKAWDDGKRFKIIIAEQEEEKTLDMIKFLQTRAIPFYVVPEFMLSHIEEDVDKVFLGGVTLTKEQTFVTDAGTNSVVAEFHHAKIPISIFISTKKFSLWAIQPKHHTYKFMKQNMANGGHGGHAMTYETVRFSHDRLPVDLVDQIVTEEAIYSPKEITKVFNKKYQDRNNWRERHCLSQEDEDLLCD